MKADEDAMHINGHLAALFQLPSNCVSATVFLEAGKPPRVVAELMVLPYQAGEMGAKAKTWTGKFHLVPADCETEQVLEQQAVAVIEHHFG